MNFSSAYKVGERHSVLVLNLGTFAEEDEAYELLNSLSISLPFVVMITSLFDAQLAAVYLKWLHPWKILLQEVSSLLFEVFLLKSLPLRNQTSGRWRQRIKQRQRRLTRWLFFILHLKPVLIYLAGNPERPGKGGHSYCQFSWTRGEKKRPTLIKKLSQESPLVGGRVVVEVELQSEPSFRQVDLHFYIILHEWKSALMHL